MDYFQIMRRREMQSFTLKLSDLKEYEAAQKERLEIKTANKNVTTAPSTSPFKLAKFGPKSKQEVRDRIGMKS